MAYLDLDFFFLLIDDKYLQFQKKNRFKHFYDLRVFFFSNNIFLLPLPKKNIPFQELFSMNKYFLQKTPEIDFCNFSICSSQIY